MKIKNHNFTEAFDFSADKIAEASFKQTDNNPWYKRMLSFLFMF